MLLIISSLVLQVLPSADSLLSVDKEVFNLNPTNVYGWLIYGLLGMVGYLKLESTLKSWTIRKKDAYIKELHQKLIDSEKNSITEEEANLYKRILAKEKQEEILP